MGGDWEEGRGDWEGGRRGVIRREGVMGGLMGVGVRIRGFGIGLGRNE